MTFVLPTFYQCIYRVWPIALLRYFPTNCDPIALLNELLAASGYSLADIINTLLGLELEEKMVQNT